MLHLFSKQEEKNSTNNIPQTPKPKSSWGYWIGSRSDLTLSSELIQQWYHDSDNDQTIVVDLKPNKLSK